MAETEESHFTDQIWRKQRELFKRLDMAEKEASHYRKNMAETEKRYLT
jgi:hypothetical protein